MRLSNKTFLIFVTLICVAQVASSFAIIGCNGRDTRVEATGVTNEQLRDQMMSFRVDMNEQLEDMFDLMTITIMDIDELDGDVDELEDTVEELCK